MAFEIIQNNVWLYFTAREYYNMYMGKNGVCGGNIKVIAIDVYVIRQCFFFLPPTESLITQPLTYSWSIWLLFEKVCFNRQPMSQLYPVDSSTI
jgi:hypothetical protein